MENVNEKCVHLKTSLLLEEVLNLVFLEVECVDSILEEKLLRRYWVSSFTALKYPHKEIIWFFLPECKNRPAEFDILGALRREGPLLSNLLGNGPNLQGGMCRSPHWFHKSSNRLNITIVWLFFELNNQINIFGKSDHFDDWIDNYFHFFSPTINHVNIYLRQDPVYHSF